MPKLIDYPRTNYAGAWELSEVVDDTGGKCAVDTAARKLSRKVSGSFKAIIGSAVKFGLLVSKRDLLTTTTLFRRIKHAYDKAEELVFHREAFLTPPLFTQICRKFRGRELPVQMLDVMLIREFGVEEINALGVAKAFTEGARAVGLLNEQNILADIDQLAARQPPRRELASPTPPPNAFRNPSPCFDDTPSFFNDNDAVEDITISPLTTTPVGAPTNPTDAVEKLFAFPRATSKTLPANSAPEADNGPTLAQQPTHRTQPALPTQSTERAASTYGAGNPTGTAPEPASAMPLPYPPQAMPASTPLPAVVNPSGVAELTNSYQVQLSGPGLNTVLTVAEEADLDLVQALLDKIRRQLRQA